VIDTVPGVLSRAKQVVDPALADAVAGLHPDLRRAAEYHLGWVTAEGTPTSGGGKGIRPALAVLSAEAVGASPDVAIPGAVAVELVHNFSLLHDDIIDGDRERRHRPTVWALFGVGTALLVGDALLALAFQVLDGGGPAAPAAAKRMSDALAAMIGGQASDMAFESQEIVSVGACREMAEAKTGAILAFASSSGAVLAGASDGQVAALDAYGQHVGLAFQAADDLLGIWGDPAVTGKPVGSDLASRKKTIPVALTMASGGKAATELRRIFRNGALDEEAVARAMAIVEAAGSREATAALAQQQLEVAIDALDGAGLEPGPIAELVALASYVCERQQ
jgi:geranylgeranyl diphosphate synthase type I